MDRVAAVEGAIVKWGTFNEWIGNPGLFQRLWQRRVAMASMS